MRKYGYMTINYYSEIYYTIGRTVQYFIFQFAYKNIAGLNNILGI